MNPRFTSSLIGLGGILWNKFIAKNFKLYLKINLIEQKQVNF